MKDKNKTKKQLIEELEILRQQVAELKDAENKYKQSEEALRSLSLIYEAILASVPDIIMEVDNNKVYTWANKAGYEFFGNDVIGKEADFYFEGEQKTYSIVEPLFKGSEDVIYVESWQRRKDGEKRLLVWWCRVLKDSSGNVIGALSTARDIT
ncbi:MAG: PAS domain S-box protein [Nitrospira sp.]|nr:PAS domain S-box protein [Nitrospira sp.]